MTNHQKVAWTTCTAVGCVAALLYLIVVLSVLCINCAEACGANISQFGMQYTDFWTYIPRILLSVSISVCFGLRGGIELSFQLLATGIFALILTFLELT